MKNFQDLVLILVLVVGLICSAIASWFFTMNAIVPYLRVPEHWQSVVGFIIWAFFACEVATATYSMLFVMVVKLIYKLAGVSRKAPRARNRR